MFVYSVIMFLTGALFAGVSLAIYKGKTDLIHDYHQTKVTDHEAYGRAFGKAMALIPASMLISGVLSLAGDAAAKAAVAVLFVGLGAGIGCIAAVQRKYNGGIF